MKKLKKYGCAVISALVGLGVLMPRVAMAGTAGSSIRVGTGTYAGWQEAVTLRNGDVVVTVVPVIGRIMFYGTNETRNLLWNNAETAGRLDPDLYGKPPEYLNHGGDKIWLNQQPDFRGYYHRIWPPDPAQDGLPHAFTLLTNGVRIVSAVSQYTGLQVERVITIPERGTRVAIDQTLVRREAGMAGGIPVRSTLWSLTQIEKPLRCRAQVPVSQIPGDAVSNALYDVLHGDPDSFRVEGNQFAFTERSLPVSKVNLRATEWICADYEDCTFRQMFTVTGNAVYPEGGRTASFFADAVYVELELFSPLFELQPGERGSNSILWEITDGGPGSTPAAL